jgi:hypothetical protein
MKVAVKRFLILSEGKPVAFTCWGIFELRKSTILTVREKMFVIKTIKFLYFCRCLEL